MPVLLLLGLYVVSDFQETYKHSPHGTPMKIIAALLLALSSASCVVAIGNQGAEDITCCEASERLGIDCPECAALAETDESMSELDSTGD